jgi:tetratricopeptide (TPR) repeat protein
MKAQLWLGALSLLLAAPAPGKQGYNVWAKEKIRFIHNKVQRNPYNAELRVILANAYYRDGRYHDAQQELEEAIRLVPGYAEAHCNLAIALQAQSQLDAASRYYKSALDIDSTMVEALSGLGTLLCRLERHAEGLKYLEKVLADDPQRSGTRYNLAVAYHKVDDFRQAIHHLETLLSYDAIYPGARPALARAYYSQGLITLQAEKNEEALVLFDKALEYKRDDTDFFFAKGLAHFALLQYEPAIKAYEGAVRLDLDHLGALQNMATAYELLNRHEEALTYYKRVQELAPHLSSIEAARDAKFGVETLIR